MSTVFARYLLYALFAAGALGTIGYTWQLWHHHQAAKAVETVIQQHNARVAQEPAHRHNFDSAFWVLSGRSREVARQTIVSQKLYDSLHHTFPAIEPVLPAQPARYGSAH